MGKMKAILVVLFAIGVAMIVVPWLMRDIKTSLAAGEYRLYSLSHSPNPLDEEYVSAFMSERKIGPFYAPLKKGWFDGDIHFVPFDRNSTTYLLVINKFGICGKRVMTYLSVINKLFGICTYRITYHGVNK